MVNMEYNSRAGYNQMVGGNDSFFKMEPQNNSGNYARRDFPHIGSAPPFPPQGSYYSHGAMVTHGGLQGGAMDHMTPGVPGISSHSNYLQASGMPVPSLTPMPPVNPVNPMTSKQEVTLPSLTPAPSRSEELDPTQSVTSVHPVTPMHSVTQEHSVTSEDRKPHDYRELDKLASDIAVLDKIASDISVKENLQKPSPEQDKENTKIMNKTQENLQNTFPEQDKENTKMNKMEASPDHPDRKSEDAAPPAGPSEGDQHGVIGVSQCSVCTVKFSSEDALHKHIETHGRICLVCFEVCLLFYR